MLKIWHETEQAELVIKIELFTLNCFTLCAVLEAYRPRDHMPRETPRVVDTSIRAFLQIL